MWTDLRCAAAAATMVASILLATPAEADKDTRCLKGLNDWLYDPKGYLNWDLGNQSIGIICSFKGVRCGYSHPDYIVQSLSLGNMSLSGQIPSALQYCASTYSLDLSYNFITGEIPAKLCTWLPFLSYLDLSRNQLSGPIPDISNCTYLFTLNLAGNRLFGQIPPTFSLRPSLQSINLSRNQLSGPIPDLFNSTYLDTLNLAGNRLSGQIPPTLSFLVRLHVLDLSENHLTGPIPDLSICTYLDTLNLADNRLSGQIPPTLSFLVRLHILDLSENHLSGPIPDLSNYTHLNTLNLSGNLLSGAIPAICCSYFDASAFSGNAALCGSPLPQCGKEGDVGKTSNASLTTIIVSVIFGAAASLLIIYSVYRWYLNLSMADPAVVPLVTDHQRIRDWVEHPADLSFLAEGNGIDTLELVGRGGCGEVYRAQLASKMIAIKKIVKSSPNEEESRLHDGRTLQARSEIITVGRIRHWNLLPLLAHVPRPDCNYLVYEYMNNGSLHDAIVRNNDLRLDWLARYRIAVGIATGLEYLHHHHKPHLIHRDLKPANILLDEHMEARISDFGLAKEFPDEETHMSMSKVAGTIGYIAPEYYQTLKFTTKCDIYSMGVILAVLVTGKLPTDDFFMKTEESSMTRWLRKVLGSAEVDPRSAIDECLLGQGFEEQMVLVLKISCFCTADDPNHRPTSKDVRCMLSQIKH